MLIIYLFSTYFECYMEVPTKGLLVIFAQISSKCKKQKFCNFDYQHTDNACEKQRLNNRTTSATKENHCNCIKHHLNYYSIRKLLSNYLTTDIISVVLLGVVQNCPSERGQPGAVT